MKSIEIWAMILFICQIALLIANPAEFWVKWLPSILCISVVIVIIGSFVGFFIMHVIFGFRKEIRRKKELLNIPEKEKNE